MSTHKTQGAGSGFRLRNWRVRSRLIALILVPTAAAVLLGGIQIFTSLRAGADYQKVNDLARLSDHIGALTHELAQERDRTSWYIALGRPQRETQAVRRQMNAVDTAAAHVRDSGALLRAAVGGRTRDEVETVLARLNDLGSLREQALGPSLLPEAAVDAYSLVIDDLLSLHDELGKGDDDGLFGQSLTLEALARAKEAASLQRALVSVVLVAGRFEQDQMEKFLGAISDERSARRTFAAEAGSDERRLFDETVNGRTADRAEFLRELVLLRADSGASLKGLDLARKDDAGEWYEAVTVTIDRMREVERRHTQAIVTRSQQLVDAEQRRALLIAGAVVVLLLAVLAITTGVARSLVKPLRRLRREALQVAGERLPAYVQQVRESRDGEVAADVVPIGVLSRDEIGEVARAFDEVHREAVRLAGDEAKLRTTVNAMFVNLSRRSQTLVERQLTLVERLERGERDDQRLADLFKLDHLATRMRRNSENLLVLAGQEVVRRWRQPVELMDVVRASLSEVENYDRVVTRVESDVAVIGPAVSDVVHLLAELVENALSFSPKESRVTVSSSRIDGGGVMLSVTDQGIGMTAEELAQVNWRLANPQAADASAARRMGLFVVGRLALKHDIRVQLRPQETGLTAMLLLPERLLASVPSHGGATRPPGSGFPLEAAPAGAAVLSAPVAQALPAPPRQGAQAVPGQDVQGGTAGPSVWSLPAERPAVPPWEDGRFPQPFPDPFGHESFGSDAGLAPDTAFDTVSNSAFDTASDTVSGTAFDISAASEPGAGEADAIGPLPEVGASALDAEEFLPIFASVESGWFRPGGSGSAEDLRPRGFAERPAQDAGQAQRAQPVEPGEPASAEPEPEPEPRPWSSPGDTGWQAAQAASVPSLGGTTASGLPRRTPKANLVPGSVTPPSDGPQRPSDVPPRSADRIRSRMASFQEGVRKARNELPKGEG
ncbi:sensor histidine kinase [Streptosporangium carneum]|uniref:sensor histidine kinase n=1 Tax=Streptosporangium carneum TaxID=47481 RepID=UPI0022F2B0E5|nr:nitrate- and nitrite sensing domain-containing protein [Streptosporangium carneum]